MDIEKVDEFILLQKKVEEVGNTTKDWMVKSRD